MGLEAIHKGYKVAFSTMGELVYLLKTEEYSHKSKTELKIYIGDLEKVSLQKVKIKGLKDRITIRFTQSTNEKINALAYALDCTPTKTTALLLDASIRNTEFINQFTKRYLRDKLDEGRMREIKKVLRFINENNPYEEKISWVTLWSYLYEELKIGTSSITTALSNWLDKVK